MINRSFMESTDGRVQTVRALIARLVFYFYFIFINNSRLIYCYLLMQNRDGMFLPVFLLFFARVVMLRDCNVTRMSQSSAVDKFLFPRARQRKTLVFLRLKEVISQGTHENISIVSKLKYAILHKYFM